MTRRILTLLAALALSTPAIAWAEDTPTPPAIERAVDSPLPSPSLTTATSSPEAPRITKPERPPVPTGYGFMLLKLVFSVAVVCAIAFVALKFGLSRLVGVSASDAPLRVLTRLPLEPKRSLIVTRVASRTLVLATSEAGVQLVTELSDADARAFTGEDEPVPFDLDAPVDPDTETPELLD